MQSPCELVIWDWNGTLLDDHWLALDCANAMLARRGLPVMDASRYREIFDFPVRRYYERAGFDLNGEPFERLADEFIAAFDARVGECGLQPGAEAALAQIASRGIRQAVLSASRQTALEAGIEAAGIAPYFTDLRGLQDHFAVSKRDRGLELMRDAGVAPDRTVMVGDTTHDADVAEAMGVAVVLVAAGHQSRTRLAATGHPVIDELSGLAALLQGTFRR